MKLDKNTSEVTEPNIVILEIEISTLLATQQREPTKIVESVSKFEKVAETEHTQGTQEETKFPVVERTETTKSSRKAKPKCHCFIRENGHVYDYLGGPYGHLKRLAENVGKTLSKNKYSHNALGLIRFCPELVDLGPDKKIEITWLLQRRNLPRPPYQVMVWQPFECVTNRTVKVSMQISRVCPLTGSEVEALLVGMRDYDGFGAAGRGKIESIKIVAS